ncbi:hypothetical protein ELE36_14625 [Pseudolysobacter antarcticus]|uniref:Sel1 repeat family protein n=1 Tax=Pseudolysobacter antarcticus TaxID=2511995 RepID=A0A411HLV4_9GAMM|nr:hypothetical protein [Pseudolysobacter antarcticus]QBB71491.1 hypothetical protein ELE36_14625 [Pseudolysobacter antarcticus]
MRRFLKVVFLATLALVTIDAFAQAAADLRKQAVGYAAKGDYARAAPLLKQAAELGYYTAQMEYAVLLDTSPTPVNDDITAYAWYSLVIARNGPDTQFVEKRRAIVVKRLNEADLKVATQSAKMLVEKYAQHAN